MVRLAIAILLALVCAGCEDHYADVIVRLDDPTGEGGARSGDEVDEVDEVDGLSREPTCEGELLGDMRLRDYEILLGRLMMWTAGGPEQAAALPTDEVARYFGTEVLLEMYDKHTLGMEFLETLDTAQRQELLNLVEGLTTTTADFRAARGDLIAELWQVAAGDTSASDTVTVSAAKAGRAEGKIAIDTIATINAVVASLSDTQNAHLEQVVSGALDPTVPVEATPDVEALVQATDGEELLAAAAKAFAWSQSDKLPPGESRRRIAAYFGYAYFDLKNGDTEADGAMLRSQLALDIYALLDLPQRDQLCLVLLSQESDIAAYQESRSSFLASAHAIPPGDEETLLALHATLGSSQGRLGLRQAQLFSEVSEGLTEEQVAELVTLYTAHGGQ